MKNVIRLKDVAKALGINPSTVSRALNNHPGIPETTRKRVKAKASKMGYRPDPALRRLAECRWATAPSNRPVSLVLITWSKSDYPYHYPLLKNAAQLVAEQLGYGFETLFIDDYPNPNAAARVLKTRGVSGIIALASSDATAWKNFPWEQFSAVQILTGEESPTGLPIIRQDSLTIMLDAGNRILKTHPASAAICLIQQPHPSATDLLDHGAALIVTNRWKKAGIFCKSPRFFKANPKTAYSMATWLANEGIDCAIVPNSEILCGLAEAKLKTPEQIKFIVLSLQENPLCAGYEWPMDQVARRAVQQLDSMIRHDEKGTSVKPETTVIPSRWVAGKSFSE